MSRLYDEIMNLEPSQIQKLRDGGKRITLKNGSTFLVCPQFDNCVVKSPDPLAAMDCPNNYKTCSRYERA